MQRRLPAARGAPGAGRSRGGSATVSATNAAISDALARLSGRIKSSSTIKQLATAGADILTSAELNFLDTGLPDFCKRRLIDFHGVGIWQAYPGLLTTYAFCVPENPIAVGQRRRACATLDLLRNCRNVLGFSDDLVPPLRFDALLRLAQQFADLAHAAESELLQYREQFESNTLSLLQAQNALALSEAELSIEALNVVQAEGDVRLADLQRAQSDGTVSYVEGLLQQGLLASEGIALNMAMASFGLQTFGVFSGGLASLAATGNPVSAGTGLPSSAAQALGAGSQVFGMMAGFERREQEWRYQLEQGRWAAEIARQNLAQAYGRLAIALGRQDLAQLSRDANASAVRFLDGAFLNRAMWRWLLQTIREQYRTRLNYAIAMSYLAERALAFELQEDALRVIRFDYFDPRRDGLLGATALQTDLATLEQHRVLAHQRRLQLSKTISLAETMPIEFELFRSGSNGRPAGILLFRTLLDWFDADFPGHYLRQIKSVRVSVFALVPPPQGIRATLRNSGISRIVRNDDGAFVPHTVRRNAEAVSLSAPLNAAGVFVLSYETDELLPFEGIGVETDWILEMPKAANPIDFRTIADVLITIDYMALEDAGYRQQVLQRLDNMTGGQRAFSFRQQFADAWYDLNNPQLVQPADRQMVVAFETLRSDFPPNASALQIDAVALFFVRDPAFTGEVEISYLHFLEDGASANASPAGGSARTDGGLVSTRRPTGSNWSNLKGKNPVGTWELRLPSDPDVQNLFKQGDIQDILLVISFSGTNVPWPN